ncbi:hypothetical protein LMG27174_04289 [Paraburkholderia rhynchosiae]|uniref:Uncharacterized protein n=1 Tax=Paraburkholderia rhynchosiae TaxID=487049 RepID=A0A6J5BNI6_9BURK|nr:hypothetical protein LMG27174_04289 [Paraburkholderia rhynchosiae]
MAPVVTPGFRMHGTHVVQMPVFLPQFVGEKKRDDKQRKDQENAQYQILDHGGLRSHKHGFYCRAPLVPVLAAIVRLTPTYKGERYLASFIFCIYTVIYLVLPSRPNDFVCNAPNRS